MSGILEKNLAALKARYPQILQRIHSVKVDQSNLSLVQGKGGAPVLAFHLPNGQQAYLDDPRDPVGAATQLADPVSDESELIVALGIGFGYHLLPLLKRRTWKRLWIIEPQLIILIAAIHYVDLSPLFLDERVTLHLEDPDPVHAVNFLVESCYNYRTDDESSMIVLPPWHLLQHPGSIAVQHAYHSAVWDQFKEWAAVSEKNRRTLELFYRPWTRNVLENVDHFLHHEGAGILYGRFTDVPAVIVGAGPSLDKNVHRLAGQEDRAAIIAVDTALATLSRAGVTPHIVVSIDAGEENIKDFEGQNLDETILAFSPVVDPAIPQKAPRRLILRYSYPLVRWVEGLLSSDLGPIIISGSVSTAAFDLAWRMGCRPLVFVGQDMAYTEQATHARSAAPSQGGELSRFRTAEASLRLRREVDDLEWTKDIEGRRIRSSSAMLGWMRWFEQRIAHQKIKAVNCTEGGLGIEGAASMTLEAFLDGAGPARNLRERFAQIRDRRARPPVDLLRRGLKRLSEEAFDFLKNYEEEGMAGLSARNQLYIATLWESVVLSEEAFLNHVEDLGEAALARRRRL